MGLRSNGLGSDSESYESEGSVGKLLTGVLRSHVSEETWGARFPFPIPGTRWKTLKRFSGCCRGKAPVTGGFFLKKRPTCTQLETLPEFENCPQNPGSVNCS